jgi:hypothetical protein
MAGLGLTPVLANTTLSAATVPVGCSVVATQQGYEVTYNTDTTSAVECGPVKRSAAVRALGDVEVVGVKVSVDLNQGMNCSTPTIDLQGEWDFLGSVKFRSTYTTMFAAIRGKAGQYKVTAPAGSAVCDGPAGCEGVLAGSKFTMISGFADPLDGTMSADWTAITWSNGAVWNRKPSCNGLATITMVGPADVWFGAGFGGSGMKGTYAITIGTAADTVHERTLGDHAPGQLLASSVQVVSNTVVAGVRTVVLHRSLIGATAAHFTFDASAQGIGLLAAVGSTPAFAYHKVRGSSVLMLVQTKAPML